jgi:hypothetical protein
MPKRLIVLMFAGVLALVLSDSAAAQRGESVVIIDDDDFFEEPVKPVPAPLPPLGDPPTWKTLDRFRSQAEFNELRLKLREAAVERGMRWAHRPDSRHDRPLLAQADAEPCDPAVEDCGGELDEVSVTGMRASGGGSITNNQESGVDEGDIVKAWDRYLVVLYQGRLFSIDTGEQAGSLKLIDRVNAYQSPETDSWIDELLIQGNKLLVTGFSYEEDASNISLFTINKRGVFELEARYFIESSDYYSRENYSTRLVDGHLVIYTPLPLWQRKAAEEMPMPRIRKWTPRAGYSSWQPLFRVQELYRPVQPVVFGGIHVVSVCSLGTARAFECASRGVVGPWEKEMYVTAKYAYLWLTTEEYELNTRPGRRWRYNNCPEGYETPADRRMRATVYRMDLETGDMRAVHTTGYPSDQFVFDERADEFLALVTQHPRDCNDWSPQAFTLARIPERLFSRIPKQLPESAYLPTPKLPDNSIQTRFAKNHVLYGAPVGYGMMDDVEESALDTEERAAFAARAQLAVVPLDGALPPYLQNLTHTPERIELFGDNAVVFGYRPDANFTVTALDLRNGLRVADTHTLHAVRETEGRSHAFNGLADKDGAGLFGIPTLDLGKEELEEYEDGVPTDVQFFRVDAALGLDSAAKLAGHKSDPEVPGGYECEVSCYDWYGNARPIFFRDRVFALTGQEIIEGALVNGSMNELARVNITRQTAHLRTDRVNASRGAR